MQTSMSNADNWDDHWQELSKDIYFTTPAVKYRWACISRLLGIENLPASSVNLIDIGCGTGHLLKYFLKTHPTINITGIDNSQVGLDLAKQKMPLASFLHADLCSPDATPNSSHNAWATHATCSEVLEHLDDPVIFLKNAGKFLCKGATLVISVPGGPMSSFDRRVGHRKHYTAELLESELTQAGYKIEKIACAGFPFHNLYRLAFILRGESILNDAKHQENGDGRFLTAIMSCFRFLFKFNLFNSRYGWTVLAKATWEG